MKKLLLLAVLGIGIVPQTECSVGSKAKAFGKNLVKTAAYGASAAVTGVAALLSYTQAECIDQEMPRAQLNRVISLLTLDMRGYQETTEIVKVAKSAKPILYGAAAVCGVAAVYSLYKTAQSALKAVTLDEE